MDYLFETDNGDGGFGLWFESDMIPAKSDWLDRIVNDWNQACQKRDNPTLVMGCYVPQVFKERFFRAKRVWVPEHINGGACYAKDFVNEIPASYRDGTFDMVIYEYLKAQDICATTESIAFSTVENCRTDLADDRFAILHGFMQEKNSFINKCMDPSSLAEIKAANAPIDIGREKRKRQLTRLKHRFIKRGRKAMLEALLTEQKYLSRVA